MYEELLLMRGFSEDCVKSILHRFISTLVQLTKSVDTEVRTTNIIIFLTFFFLLFVPINFYFFKYMSL